ncbi:MAG: S41 family peptidase [Gammaproteobacteria bacterium]
MKHKMCTLGLLALASIVGLAAIEVDAESGAATESEQDLPWRELRTFTEVFAKVKNDYVEPIKDKQLLENAIRGMLTGLDPHSAYLDPEDYKGLQEGTTGEFGGLGIEVGIENGLVKVIAPIDDTPAQRAGVKPGDVITKLDDTPVKGMALNDAVKHMRGKPGSPITLTIVREGVEKPLEIVITRAVIKVESIKTELLEPNFGYLRISTFQERTAEDLRRALGEIKAENKGPLKGMVLDLRNNPGGILSAAVSVADAFIEKGLIVYTEGRVEDSQLRFSAKPDDLLSGASMVVLVNGGSASASEIVAGALQDSRRGIIMGSRTFGKGSVQTILPMSNQAALKLTTALYYTPSGRSIQAEGIKPDILLDKVEIAVVEDDDPHSLKEADLSRHLANSKQTIKNGGAQKQARDAESMASSDYELYQALNLLKGLALSKPAKG